MGKLAERRFATPSATLRFGMCPRPSFDSFESFDSFDFLPGSFDSFDSFDFFGFPKVGKHTVFLHFSPSNGSFDVFRRARPVKRATATDTFTCRAFAG